MDGNEPLVRHTLFGMGMANGTYRFFDLTPMGRGGPAAFPPFWVRRYDEYGA
jgi:predicted dithiol-disulfide oxidoreductase (DUF899 family)